VQRTNSVKINISLRVYAAYSRHLLYTLYLIPCCTPDLQRTPTWKESANGIMECATLDRCHHFHGHSGMCAQLASWFELFCFSSLPGRVLISVPRGLCQKYFCARRGPSVPSLKLNSSPNDIYAGTMRCAFKEIMS